MSVPLWTMDHKLYLVSVNRDPMFDRKASIVVGTSLILLDFVLPYYFQILLDLFLGFDEISFNLGVFVATAFLVENLKRFALWKQPAVDGMASTGPHRCFHLVKMLIGRNVVHIWRIIARFSNFGYFSSEIAAFVPSGEILLCLRGFRAFCLYWQTLCTAIFGGLWKRNKTAISVESERKRRKNLLRMSTNLSHFCSPQLLHLSEWRRWQERQHSKLKNASFRSVPVHRSTACVVTAWVSRVKKFCFETLPGKTSSICWRYCYGISHCAKQTKF